MSDAVPVVKDFKFTGRGLSFLWLQIWTVFLIAITGGIFFPWSFSAQQRWQAKHTYVQGKRLVFKGTGVGLIGNWLLIMFLTLITGGIYIPWAYCRIQRWKTNNLRIVDTADYQEEESAETKQPPAYSGAKLPPLPPAVYLVLGVVLVAIGALLVAPALYVVFYGIINIISLAWAIGGVILIITGISTIVKQKKAPKGSLANDIAH
jgi:hypothetical protein